MLSWIFIGFSLKQQSTDRYVAPLWHIILIPSQPVFALSPECCVLSGQSTNANFIVFGLTWEGFNYTWGEHANHYTTDAIILKFHDQFPIFKQIMTLVNYIFTVETF